MPMSLKSNGIGMLVCNFIKAKTLNIKGCNCLCVSSSSEPHLHLRVDLKSFSESKEDCEEWMESATPSSLPNESRQARLQGLIMNQVSRQKIQLGIKLYI